MREGVQAWDKASEETIISAMLCGSDVVLDYVESMFGDIGSSAFYIKLHELVYDAVMALRDTDTVIDPANVAVLIDHNRVGMTNDAVFSWLTEYTFIGDIWSVESVAYHANRVKDMAKLRVIDKDLRSIITENMSSDADLESVYRQLEEVLERRACASSGEVISVSRAKEIYKQYVADIQKKRVQFGWPSIDNATRGLIPGDVCLIFARTNVGKSALAQSMQISIWERQSIKSIFFSLEMPVTSVYERMASMISGWQESEIEGIFLTEDEDRLLGDLVKYEDGVFFVEKSSLMLRDISRITKSVDNIGVIFIDYMGLVKGLGRSPYERLSDIATGLKVMAKDLGIVVVCICQLSRKAGDGSVPVSFEMVRDSGQIEEASDVILGMHRSLKPWSIRLRKAAKPTSS